MNSLDIKIVRTVPAEYRYAQIKRDGISIEFQRNRNKSSLQHGKWTAWTRTPTNVTEHMQRVPSARRVFLITKLNRLSGELFWPGHEAKDVKSALADGLHNELVFEVYWLDIYVSRDTAGINSEHQALLMRGMHYMCLNYGLTFTPFIDLHEPLRSTIRDDARGKFTTVKGFAPGTLPTQLLLACRDPDSDGWVLKDHAHSDRNWCKLKPYNTTELELIGYTEGKGKYSGLIGALVLSGNVKCSGMDDATRRMFSADRMRYLGHKVEVAFEKVIRGTNGLRHPRFVKLREDLPRC